MPWPLRGGRDTRTVMRGASRWLSFVLWAGCSGSHGNDGNRGPGQPPASEGGGGQQGAVQLSGTGRVSGPSATMGMMGVANGDDPAPGAEPRAEATDLPGPQGHAGGRLQRAPHQPARHRPHFQIPADLRAQYGYPELTPERKAKIFGLNAARLFCLTPQ